MPPAFACHAPARPPGDGLGDPRKVQHEEQGWREVLTNMGVGDNNCLLMLVQGEQREGGGVGGQARALCVKCLWQGHRASCVWVHVCCQACQA